MLLHIHNRATQCLGWAVTGGVDRFKLGRLLAVAPDGQAVAVAAFHARLAIFNVDGAAANPFAGAAPTVYAGRQPVQVHGAVPMPETGDSPQAMSLHQGLGTIWDMCFMHTAAGVAVKHLAVLTHRCASWLAVLAGWFMWPTAWLCKAGASSAVFLSMLLHTW